MEKSELLAKYARKSPTQFVQFDCFGPDDSVEAEWEIHGASSTTELMDGSLVRLLISPGVPAVNVANVLDVFANSIRRDGLTTGNKPENEAAAALRRAVSLVEPQLIDDFPIP